MEEQGYRFIRYADDIKIYTDDDQKASGCLADIKEKVKEYGLTLSDNKSGVFESTKRFVLGYHFEKKGNKWISSNRKLKSEYYSNWHSSAIQQVETEYHLINNGILSKKDFTILFENDSGKHYLPVESTDALNVYSEVIFTSNFFQFVSDHKLRISIFDKYGNGVGCFSGSSHGSLGRTMLKQAELYLNGDLRLAAAKTLMMAALHNVRSNIRYYNKKITSDTLTHAVSDMSESIKKINECKSIEDMMLIEARARQTYYNCFNSILSNEDFYFTMRTRRPPKDALNALISFGNTYMYNQIATEIMKTSLDIRIGIIHATNNRAESLNLDIAELFKPLIVDRVIFTLVNRRMIDTKNHFEEVNNGGIYLNNNGKRIFLEELRRKMHSKITIGQQMFSYETLIRNEVKKIYRLVVYGEKYKPYKYT